MKPITKVFLIIGTLVLGLLVWQLVFNQTGVIATGWNAVVAPVNEQYQRITGKADATLIPTFGDGSGYTDDVGNMEDAGW